MIFFWNTLLWNHQELKNLVTALNELPYLTLRDSPCGNTSNAATIDVTTQGVSPLIEQKRVFFHISRETPCVVTATIRWWAAFDVSPHGRSHNVTMRFGSARHVKKYSTFLALDAENGFRNLKQKSSPLSGGKSITRAIGRGGRWKFQLFSAQIAFQDPKSLDFQGPPLPMALEIDFPLTKSLLPAPYKQQIH